MRSFFAAGLLLSLVCVSPALAHNEQQLLSDLHRTEKSCGAEDSRTGEFLFGVGTFYHKQKQYDKEATMYNRAMAIFAKHPGVNGDLLRYYSDQLARAYAEEGRCAESEKLYKQAIELGNKLPGRDKTYAVPNTLAGLADLYKSQKRYADAEAALKQRIEMRHRFMNAGQVDLALVDLADLYTQWAKYDEAQKVFQQLLQISPMPVQVRQAYSTYLAKTSDNANRSRTD